MAILILSNRLEGTQARRSRRENLLSAFYVLRLTGWMVLTDWLGRWMVLRVLCGSVSCPRLQDKGSRWDLFGE